MRRLARHRAPVLLVTAVLLLGSCRGGDSGTKGAPDPTPVVEALAQALAGGTLAAVTWTPQTAPDAQAGYDAIVEGMGDLTPTVEPGGVAETSATDSTPASAVATLTWHWPVGDNEWVYDVDAVLTLAGDAWQVTWAPSLVEPSLRAEAVLDTSSLRPRRGDLIGNGGVRLITDRAVVRFGIDRTQVPPARAGASARRLARLLGVDARGYAARVKAAGQKAFVEAIVYRRDDVPPGVGSAYQSIRGARAVQGTAQLGASATFAAPLLGRVGEVTAEMIDKDPERYHLGDVAGLSGLEARYDEQLVGSPGVAVDAVASDGKRRKLFRVPATNGTPVRLTLDLGLQLEAEGLLADVGPAAALVAIRPSTGAVLVAANGPGANGVNIATYGRAAPGSTFKTVSGLALLRAGLTPSSRVSCTSSIVVDGKTFTNYDDYPPGGLGRIPLSAAVANSCNTAFISEAPAVGRRGLAQAAASLGFGIDHDLGFPAYFGQVEPTTSSTEAAADMIGQGKVLASPLVMATVIASAQAGRTVVPTLVKGIESPVPPQAQPLTGGEARSLRSLLRGVVTSGSGRLLLDLPGPPVIAKTGTAEFDKGGKRLTHAWMLAAHGDLAVAVFVDVGSSGSGTAGPILEAFLRAAR